MPFIGEKYGTTAEPFGIPTLVLGESSYDKENPNRGEPLPLCWNHGIINCVRKCQKDNTITRAAGVFYGEWRSWEQRWDFWQSVAFANFVQVDMGCHGERPTASEWDGGKEPFQEYLETLKPGFVLALGAELCDHLPSPCHIGEVHINRETRPYRLYDNGGGCTFVFGIHHPISYRWSYARWTRWVNAALAMARNTKCR